MVKRRDRRDDTEQGRALGVDAALFAMVRQVATEDLPIVLEHFIGTEQEDVADPARLVHSIFHAQPGFGGDQRGDSSLRRLAMSAARLRIAARS